MTSTAPSRNHHHHKPLHNFSLPFLNWGQKPRCNRFPTTTPDADVITTRKTRHHHHNPKHNPHDDFTTTKHKKSHHKKPDADVIRKDTRKSTNSDDDDDVTDKLVDVDVAAAVEVELKPWKLRPRKSVTNGKSNGNGEVNGNGDGDGGGVRSGRLLRTVEVVAADQVGVAEEEDRERMMKRRLWISLSKDEIEHDILMFTGAKPVRRPKKRNKIAQKHLDNVFPGLYLVGMSADSYRV